MPKKIRSRDYWRQREDKQRRKNLKDQVKYDKRIKSIYQKAMDNIQKEIDSFYARYAKKEGIALADAKKRAAKLDIEAYARKAERYVEEKDFSKQANEEMRLYNLTMKVNRLELLKANIGLELVDSFNDLQQFYDEKLTDRTMDELERQAGILGATVTETEAAERAKVLVNSSFRNATWSERIWTYQDLLKNELDKLLRTGLIQGRNPRELARELRKSFDVSRHDAERLMRTELCRVQTAAQKDSFERNGYEEYEFICCGLPDACPECKALDGKIFKVKDMMPGENAPPIHPNDHCSTAAHVSREEFDAWLDAKAVGGTEKVGEELDDIVKIKKSLKFEDGIEKLVNSGKLKVIENMFHSVGAKAREYKVYNPVTREYTTTVPGTPLTQPKNHVMAGKGRNRKIDIIDLLLFKYKNTYENEWTYEKGFGYVYDNYGDSRVAELHWFQNPKVGKCEMKIKQQPDGRLYLD